MSIIEIVLTFALIMAMVVGMFTIVMNYRDKASLSLKKLEMDTFKNTLTKDIQDDILKLGIKEINMDGECNNVNNLAHCINIVFNDDSEKAFGTSKVDISDIDSIKNKYLYYDGEKYKLTDTLPEKIPAGRNVLDFQSITVEDNNILSTDSIILDNGLKVNIYSIDVYVSHVDFDQDFGIHIVATSDSNLDDEIVDDENGDSSSDGSFLLKDAIMKNTLITATPTLTNSSNNTSDASGLYSSTDTNTGNPTYYFRGNVTNNYVSFAGFTWRVVRINEDGTIRIVMQDGINNNANIAFNSNNNDYSYMYYSNSEVKTQLNSWYQTNIGSKSDLASNVVSGSYYCEQAKAKRDSSYTAGSANMTVYSSYTPDFKCATDGNGKGVVNASVGLLSYDEVVYAGGYYMKTNSIYYLYNPSIYWWTMSPAGFTGYYSSVWYVHTTGISTTAMSIPYAVRPVLILNADVLATGSGTSDDPYVVL